MCFEFFNALRPSQQFFIHVGTTSTKQPIKCLDQGHNIVTSPAVSHKLATVLFPVHCSRN